MKLGTERRFVNHKYNFEAADLDSKLYLGRFGLKNAMCLIFMKFGTQNKLNILIMNMLIGID